MSSFGKDCPQCGQNNAAYAVRCRCGYAFNGEPEEGDGNDSISPEEEALYIEYLTARAGQAATEAQRAQAGATAFPDNREKVNLAKQAQSAAERARAELEAAKGQFAAARAGIQGALASASVAECPTPQPAPPAAAPPEPKPVQPQRPAPKPPTPAAGGQASQPVLRPVLANETAPKAAAPVPKPGAQAQSPVTPAPVEPKVTGGQAAASPRSVDAPSNVPAGMADMAPTPRQPQTAPPVPPPVRSPAGTPPAPTSTYSGAKTTTTSSPAGEPPAPSSEQTAAARAAAMAQVKLLEATLARLRAAKHGTTPQAAQPRPSVTPPTAASGAAQEQKQAAERAAERPAKVNGTAVHAAAAVAGEPAPIQGSAQSQAPTSPSAASQAPGAKADPTKKECPNCTAVLPVAAERCRCGFKFATVEESMPSLSLSDNELDAIGTDLGQGGISRL